jgi:hypothetical protein
VGADGDVEVTFPELLSTSCAMDPELRDNYDVLWIKKKKPTVNWD